MIYLETERLILRDYREEDFDDYYRLKSDSKTMYYLQDIQLFTRDEACEDFNKVLNDMKKCNLIKEAEHIDYEWHDGKMKTRLEYRMLKNEWR